MASPTTLVKVLPSGSLTEVNCGTGWDEKLAMTGAPYLSHDSGSKEYGTVALGANQLTCNVFLPGSGSAFPGSLTGTGPIVVTGGGNSYQGFTGNNTGYSGAFDVKPDSAIYFQNALYPAGDSMAAVLGGTTSITVEGAFVAGSTTAGATLGLEPNTNYTNATITYPVISTNISGSGSGIGSTTANKGALFFYGDNNQVWPGNINLTGTAMITAQPQTFSGFSNLVQPVRMRTLTGTISGTGDLYLNAEDNNSTISTTYSGNLNGSGSVIKVGTGVLTLNGSNTYTGSTSVTAGTLVIGVSGALPAASNVSIGSNSTMVMDSQSTETSTNSLNINGSLIIHGGSLATLQTAAQAGYAAGWNSPTGISSSAAASNTAHLTAVGIIQDDDGTATGTPLTTSFEGQTVSESDVLAKYTWYGDTNLDGKVDGSDYSRIDNAVVNNMNSSNIALTGWFNGDFNYDGVINGSDYTLIDNSYNTQGASLAGEVASPTAQIAGSVGTSAVPEPATLSLLGIGAAGLLGRRRRHN